MNEDINVGDTVRLPHWPESLTFRVTGETARSLVGVVGIRGIERTHEECYPRLVDWVVVPKPRPELPPRLDRWAPVYADYVGGAQLTTAEAVAANHRAPGYPDLVAVVRYTSTETVRWIGTDGELEA